MRPSPSLALPLVCLLSCLLLSPALSGDNSDAPPASAPASVPVPAPAPGPAPEDDPYFGNPCSVEWFQAHGWLMWVGFGSLMPMGIITSRHLQTVTSAWFHVHITCMTLAIACIVAGGGIAFAKFEAIPDTPMDDPAAVHVYFGTAVFIMACLNFLFGIMRPHKGNKPRLWWYAAHFTFGTCAVAFAWYEIFSGMEIYEENWVIDIPSGLPDLHVLKVLFAIQIAVLSFAYLLLGRWDYLIGQQEEGAPLDGIRRLTSTWHLGSMINVSGAEHKLEEREAMA